jgi:hypothetical protein
MVWLKNRPSELRVFYEEVGKALLGIPLNFEGELNAMMRTYRIPEGAFSIAVTL